MKSDLFMDKDNTVYLKHIRDAALKIEQYLKGITQEKFLKNSLIQDAVSHEVQIIGEAVRHISSDFRRRYPDIAWRDIASMRSKIVHDYFGINLKIIWNAATKQVPKLKANILKILNQK